MNEIDDDGKINKSQKITNFKSQSGDVFALLCVVLFLLKIKHKNGLLQSQGTDDSGAGTHWELVNLGRERPLGTTRNLEFPKCGYVQKTRIVDITALCGFKISDWDYSLIGNMT